jgi:hypothetical protein
MERVISSNVHSIGHNKDTKILTVKFIDGGRLYEYYNVSEETYNNFLNAESKGKFLDYKIKPYYSYKKVG